MQGVRAPTEKMSRSLSFSRPCYSGLLSVGLVALLLGVDHAFARFVDVIRNDISLPEDVDAGDAKPADIDGDGDIDFVIKDFNGIPGAAYTHRIAWVRNDGGDNWAVLPLSISEFGGSDLPFDVADIDNDGDLDVVTGSYGSTNNLGTFSGQYAALRVYTNNGEGSFTRTTILETNFFNQFFAGAKYIVGVTMADLDRDRDLDIIFLQGGSVNRVAWVPNNGNGSYGEVQVIWKEDGLNPRGIDTGDVDRDGDIDIVINSSPERLVTEEGYFTEIICMKNPSRGGGQWQRTVVPESSRLVIDKGIFLADMDNDSILDIAGAGDGASAGNARYGYHRGDGMGNFRAVEALTPLATGQVEGFHIVDFDGDGDLDWFIARPGINDVRYEEREGGRLSGRSSLSLSRMGAPQRTSGTGLFTADVNGDGRLDLVTHGAVMTWWDLIPFDNPSGLPPELPVSLGSLDRALPMQFNTLGSTIDTEMALYGPEGKLLRENDNFNETGQSAIAIPPNLEEGTYYIAVGQHNTIFGGGFYTRAPSAAAADFLFNWGENRAGVPFAAESIQGALPADGVQWFSFEITSLDTVDTDSDGITDSVELELGTDPNNAGDRPFETGGSIGINFVSNRDPAATILPAERAGFPEVAQTNWNNTKGAPSGDNFNFFGDEVTLVDSEGQSSRIIVTWDANSTYNTSNGSEPADNQLMNGYLDNVGPGGFSTVDFLNITYANYDVYVYFGADQNGRSGAIESATAGQTFSYSTFSQFSAGGLFPLAYARTTDQGSGDPLANFCVFRNQSSGSFSVQLNRGINNSGIYGIQIVPTDPTNQDLIDNVGATVEDAIPLGVLGDRDTSVGFSTLKSSIDTEIAIFTPLGTLAQENDDIGGTSQSVIGARGLLPGTWYLAVGEYDTSFADGFEVTGGASGSVFTLSVAPSGEELRVRIPFGGVAWFSFEMRPNPLGLPPTLPVSLGSLGDGSLPLQFSTLGSTIDTEMALFGPKGELLTESDDINETLQSGITAATLQEGTHYIAVGQHDTIFREGFSVEAPPEAANFLFNYGENKSIKGVIPADGVQWFSFEIGPIVTPEVALAEVWFADGSFNMSWQTDLGVRYRVQRSSDLQSWENVGSVIPGNGNVLEHSQSITNMREFFRVVIP